MFVQSYIVTFVKYQLKIIQRLGKHFDNFDFTVVNVS